MFGRSICCLIQNGALERGIEWMSESEQPSVQPNNEAYDRLIEVGLEGKIKYFQLTIKDRLCKN